MYSSRAIGPGRGYRSSSRAMAAQGRIAARRNAQIISRRIPASLPASLAGRYRRTGFYQRFGAAAAAAGFKPEKKFFDTTLSFLFDTTGEVPATGQLALIPQGDTESTRDGRECVIKGIHIRGNMTFTPAAAATAAGATHLYLILDTQCNGAAAAITDVFTESALSVSMLNLANSGRFRILKHWTHYWNASAGVTTAYNDIVKAIDFYKPLNLKMQFSSTTGAITEIKSNNLFLCAGATANIDDLVTFAGRCRLRFMG